MRGPAHSSVRRWSSKRGGLLQAVGLDAPGGQLDRERHAVELSADVAPRWRLRRRSRSRRAPLASARSTNSWVAGKSLDGRRRELADRPADRRAHPVYKHARRRPAAPRGSSPGCGRWARPRRCCDASGCHRFDQMLAGVEDQQNPLVPQIGNQAGRRVVGLHRQPQHGGDRRGHQLGIAQHAEIDEQHGAGEGLASVMSDRDRDRGLADAARAHDRDKARSGQPARQLRERRRRARPFASSGWAGWRAENLRGDGSAHRCRGRSTARSAPRSNSPVRRAS